GARYGKRTEQERVGPAENSAIGADADCERDDGNHREARVFDEYANAVLEVLAKPLEPEPNPTVTRRAHGRRNGARRRGERAAGVVEHDVSAVSALDEQGAVDVRMRNSLRKPTRRTSRHRAHRPQGWIFGVRTSLLVDPAAFCCTLDEWPAARDQHWKSARKN